MNNFVEKSRASSIYDNFVILVTSMFDSGVIIDIRRNSDLFTLRGQRD